MIVIAAVDAQTLVDAVGLGAVYALMAVGIGLVFGMLRLVNFAYGQLIMAGAYTLAFTSGWPVAGSVLACFAVVIALSFLMDGVVFRPLRTQSPAVMLVTTFAVAFLLQAVALILDIRDGTIGEPAVSVASLNQVVTVGGVDIRKVTILAVVVAIVALALLALLLGRTTIGLQMRAAATDFRTARLLGVKADRVIGDRGPALRDPRRDGGGDPDRPVPARLARLRAQGDDRRARRRRRRRDRPALDGDARRLRDRLRDRRDQRRAARPTRPSSCPRWCSRS